jgi:hypothetical protein
MARIGGIGNPLTVGGGGGSVDWTDVSGDATANASAVFTLADPHRIHVATVSLTATEIVGNTAGKLAHASGVTVVAGEAGILYIVERMITQYTFVTAAYTGGGNTTVRYQTTAGSVNATQPLGATDSFGASNSVMAVTFMSGSPEGATSTASGLIGRGLSLNCTAQYTQPGTAAGTAVVTIEYRKVALS